ncbi:MAG: hypothetical protein UHG68_03685 [Clostridia bacterium]|nr:hypothetical protein [Clostridia bacterium]
MKHEIALKLKIYTIMFLFGGACYCIAELLWRGRTHWTMALCGGLCFALIYLTNEKLRGANILKQAAICALFITMAELIFGFVVNIIFEMDVWDYSAVFANFLGQICLPFSILWFFVSFPCLYLCRVFKKCLE